MSTVLEASEISATRDDRHAFNLAVWNKIVANPDFADMPYRFESDEHGQIIMSPPPAPSHGNKQSKIVRLLWKHAPSGEVISECPISTSKGVRAADIAWCSPEIWQGAAEKSCFLRCPEICVEVISPSNTRGEIDEKVALYFEAGAAEVWLCSDAGEMTFLVSGEKTTDSTLCPNFPNHLD